MSKTTSFLVSAYETERILTRDMFIFRVLVEVGQFGVDVAVPQLTSGTKQVLIEFFKKSGSNPGEWFHGGTPMRHDPKVVDPHYENIGHAALYKWLLANGDLK